MGVFDGVALAIVSSTRAGDAASLAQFASQLERVAAFLLPNGDRTTQAQAPGFPTALETPSGDMVVAIPLAATPADGRGQERQLTDLRGHLNGAEGWRVSQVALMPPGDASGLRGLSPSGGGRTHLAARGGLTSLCGRVPASGRLTIPGDTDCVRCLRSSAVSAVHARQLEYYPQLVESAGELVTGAAAQLWRRLAHRHPGQCPELLDSMAGAVACGLPGAPEANSVLTLVRRHQEVASPAVVSWAVTEMNRRVREILPPVFRSHPSKVDTDVYTQLLLFVKLAGAAESAEELVPLLRMHGPAPAYEPLIARVARQAGDEVSEEVDQWRRIQAVAGALAGRRR